MASAVLVEPMPRPGGSVLQVILCFFTLAHTYKRISQLWSNQTSYPTLYHVFQPQHIHSNILTVQKNIFSHLEVAGSLCATWLEISQHATLLTHSLQNLSHLPGAMYQEPDGFKVRALFPDILFCYWGCEWDPHSLYFVRGYG